MMPEYNIDQNGTDGRYRVWWLNAEGYTCERSFNSRESAEQYVKEMASLSEDDSTWLKP